DDEFGLVIDLGADGGQDDGLTGADEGGGVLAEQDGFARDGGSALGGVVAVVEADAHDLARVGDGRGEGDSVGRGAGGGGGGGGWRAAWAAARRAGSPPSRSWRTRAGRAGSVACRST